MFYRLQPPLYGVLVVKIYRSTMSSSSRSAASSSSRFTASSSSTPIELLKATLGFEMKETVVTQSQTIKGMVDNYASSAIPVCNITGRILTMVIEWWNKHKIGAVFEENELKE
ncbi:hypothetical protein Dsin_016589 [Dipteronia sinensis]|uniref:SKP1 component POZ domain-containing protein n=1 Tax=Dipteronia sinensis TaxID=43782 RepID=A0AAE0E739_9ROSI|nr:hypothetical protein Dsin_016589 [Dipteronia sinensis]